MNKEIKPCEGVGDIKFGMTRDELISAVGEPDEVHEIEFDENESAQTWHYDSLELSVSFEEEADWTLTVMSMSSEEFTFNNKKLIGQDMESILGQLKELGAVRVDLEEEEMDHELVVVEKLNLNLWFEGSLSEGNTKLTEIQLEVCE